MRNLLILLGVTSLFIGGCASAPDISKLSNEAQTALLQAKADIEAADHKNVNTVQAHVAYDAAVNAANHGSNAEVIKHGRAADVEALKAIKRGK